MYHFLFNDLPLPVAPEKVSIKIGNQNKSLTLISGQEINVLKRPGLSKITFTCMLPHTKYPFAYYPTRFHDPRYFLEKFEKLKTELKPFTFRIIRTFSPNNFGTTSFKVSLEDYEIVEDAEKYGLDVYVNITLLQYNDFGTKVIKFKEEETEKKAVVEPEKRDESTAPTAKGAITYTVKYGDCPWNIAKKYLGNGARWKELLTAENIKALDEAAKKVGKSGSQNGYFWVPGAVITIPAK